jgi:hypothetical protein
MNTRLSEYYLMSMSQVQKNATELYENLHDEKGNPLVDIEIVKKRCLDFILSVRRELDFIREAVKEHNETGNA